MKFIYIIIIIIVDIIKHILANGSATHSCMVLKCNIFVGVIKHQSIVMQNNLPI